jgi:hypothetical protein
MVLWKIEEGSNVPVVLQAEEVSKTINPSSWLKQDSELPDSIPLHYTDK